LVVSRSICFCFLAVDYHTPEAKSSIEWQNFFSTKRVGGSFDQFCDWVIALERQIAFPRRAIALGHTDVNAERAFQLLANVRARFALAVE
jgi:hypothetical protein